MRGEKPGRGGEGANGDVGICARMQLRFHPRSLRYPPAAGRRSEVRAAPGRPGSRAGLEPREEVRAPRQPSPRPRHLFLLLTAEGLSGSLFHRAGRRTRRAAAAAPGASAAHPGRGRSPANGGDTGDAFTALRDGPARSPPGQTRSARPAHAQSGPPSDGAGLPSDGAGPPSRGRGPGPPGSGSAGAAGSGPRHFPTNPLTGLTAAVAATRAWGPWSWASCSTTSPSTSRRCVGPGGGPPAFQACVQRRAVPPSCPQPHRGGSLGVDGRGWMVWLCYFFSLRGQLTLFYSFLISSQITTPSRPQHKPHPSDINDNSRRRASNTYF